MCIAILAPAGKRLSNSMLSNSFQSNPDGAGMAFIKDGKVAIVKGLFKEQDLIDSYHSTFNEYGQDNAMLIHCRIATAGVVNKDNCHPFKIKGGAMIHNGHLWNVPGGHAALHSDTREFANIFHNILDYDSVCRSIDEGEFNSILYGDKMAFLYDDGRYLMSDGFHEHQGIYFSNHGYQSHSAWRSTIYGDTEYDFNWHN